MATSTMAMSMSHTATSAAASATSTAMSGMGGMSGGGSASCKISMLWNWYTIDACFLSRSWHITSRGMFAGSCIGVICFVITLEFLRRLGKEYDRFLLRQHKTQVAHNHPRTTTSSNDGKNSVAPLVTKAIGGNSSSATFRPTILQQAIRALLHMLQFAVAYFIMLLAMYYNGYVIICIFIGAYLGFFIFGWEVVTLEGPKEETTVCCG